MENISTTTLVIAPESFIFYTNSGYFYLTGRTVEANIENNKITFDKGVLCQFKFATNILNLSPDKIFSARRITFKVESKFENCFIKGANACRFAATEILSYEDNNWQAHSK